MSLDVYLRFESNTDVVVEKILIRENGTTKSLTREEWEARFPGQSPFTVLDDDSEVYEANITHNLNKMAGEAGIYEHLWRPDEIGIETASQLVQPLTEGLERLKANPAHFRTFNPANGWGDYDGLVTFVESYLKACKEYPQASVRVSR